MRGYIKNTIKGSKRHVQGEQFLNVKMFIHVKYCIGTLTLLTLLTDF